MMISHGSCSMLRRLVAIVACAQCAHALQLPSQRVAAPVMGTAATLRQITKVEKPIRLPVWPVVNGLACIALDLVGQGKLAASLEDNYGGRVAPMSLGSEADPFVLLVHHRHGFDSWDPVRPLFEALIGLPEGFPAHPHRGFETVTATMRGGLRHRDSVGVEETYGDGDVQWLTAGKGVLHEEMWWWDEAKGGRGECELYQLWVNLPRAQSSGDPSTTVLRAADLPTAATPGVVETDLDASGGSITEGARGTGPARGDVSLKRVALEPGARYERAVPRGATVLAYARRGGGVELGGAAVPRHSLAYTAKGGERLVVENASADEAAEILLLVGMPVNEPVAASGTWVVSTQAELAQADADYAAGRLGRPWPHTHTDAEWREWVSENGPF